MFLKTRRLYFRVFSIIYYWLMLSWSNKNNSRYAPWFIQLSSKISQKQDQTDIYDVIHWGDQSCLSAAQSKSDMEKFTSWIN